MHINFGEFRCFWKHFEESAEKKPKGLLRAYTVGLPMKVDEIADDLEGRKEGMSEWMTMDDDVDGDQLGGLKTPSSTKRGDRRRRQSGNEANSYGKMDGME